LKLDQKRYSQGTHGQESSKLVLAGLLPVSDAVQTEMVADTLVTVAEVLGLDDVNDLAVGLEVGHGNKLGLGLHDPLRQGRNVVHGLALAVDGVLHGLVDGLLEVQLGHVLVVLVLLHQVLALSVDLELGGDSLKDVNFPGGHVLADGQAADGTLPQLDLEGLATDGQALVVTLIFGHGRGPAQGQLGLDLSIFGLGDLFKNKGSFK